MARTPPTIVASGNGASALPAGIRILTRGGSALDAVEACAKIIEADPTDTSVGRGGKPNVLGEVELDASIVDGTTHRVGAVGALKGYLHPISIARAVMERRASRERSERSRPAISPFRQESSGSGSCAKRGRPRRAFGAARSCFRSS